MIKLLEKDEVQGVVDLISTTVAECIIADKSDLNIIIDSSVKETMSWLQSDAIGIHLAYKIDSKIVGTILIKDYWNMVSLFVLPGFHGKGIATSLVTEALITCKEKSACNFIKLN